MVPLHLRKRNNHQTLNATTQSNYSSRPSPQQFCNSNGFGIKHVPYGARRIPTTLKPLIGSKLDPGFRHHEANHYEFVAKCNKFVIFL